MSVTINYKRRDCDKKKENCAHILISHERSFTLVFWLEECLVETLPCTWNFGPNWHRSRRNANFQSIFGRSDSAVTHSEKSSISLSCITLIGSLSTTRFPMSLKWTSLLLSPQRGSTCKTTDFRVKLHFTWRKSAAKLILCVNTVSDKVVRHSMAYLYIQKWFAGNVPWYVKLWPKLTNFFKNADFPSIFARSASAVIPSKKFNWHE